jgi:large subunit ribosomal protein L23
MSRNRAAKLLNNPYAILRRPILTEKSHDMIAPKGAGAEGEDEERKGRYTFDVHVKANKQQIKRAIEAAFGVKVLAVNTMIVKPRAKSFRGMKIGTSGFSRARKKAIVRLTKDSKQIELM